VVTQETLSKSPDSPTERGTLEVIRGNLPVVSTLFARGSGDAAFG